jgi:PAS domain S-box-containing protein
MPHTISLLIGEHDWRLVVVAGIVCLLASLIAVSLYRRTHVACGSVRRAWLARAAAATGRGISARHLRARSHQITHAQQQLIEQSEEKLRQQNRRLDSALNNMTQGLCMFDSDETIVVFNRRFMEMYRLSPQVVKPGCKLRDLIQHRKDVGLLDADPEQFYRKIMDRIRHGRTATWLVKTTDGRLIQAFNQPMPGGGWLTTHEDVTERHRAEEQVREQKLQLDTALDNIG